MSSLRLVFLSLIHYGRNSLAVGFGVAVATAVLTGALLVGDSMRGSLRSLTLDRLGRIDQALVAEGFFREILCDQLAAAEEFPRYFSKSAPVILLSASIQSARGEPPLRANRVNLIGCDDRVSQLGPSGPGQLVGLSGITINQALADALEIAGPGQEALLRLPDAASIPSDSPLGNKEETIRRARVTVSRIIPNEGLGRSSACAPANRFPRTPSSRSAGCRTGSNSQARQTRSSSPAATIRPARPRSTPCYPAGSGRRRRTWGFQSPWPAKAASTSPASG